MNPLILPLVNALTQILLNLGNSLNTNIEPLFGFLSTTPPALTTDNPVVHAAWLTMTLVADSFLGLYVTVTCIQMMQADAVGRTHRPIGQFLGKVVLTVILIHASAFLGQELLLITNALCNLVRFNVQAFILQVNGGKPFDPNQQFGLDALLGIFLALSLLRIIFQALKRVVQFILLFVLSGPAFLLSLDEQTVPWFQFWLRMYLTTILTQFVQFLAFGLGFQLFISVSITQFTKFLLAIALLNMTAQIPSLLSRFATSPDSAGAAGMLRGAVSVARIFI